MMEELIAISSIINENATLWAVEQEDQISALTKLLEEAEILAAIEKRKNRETSYQFNMFGLFSVNEPKHSEILASILDPSGTHGQGDAFLKLYLREVLGYSEQETSGVWNVVAETDGRVDILIRRDQPHAAIIIENKSNRAGDQESQLYRYWHRVIYSHCNDYSCLPKSYRIVYLSPGKEKTVTAHSLKRPDTFMSEILPEQLPLEWISQHYYDEQIIPWLENCVSILPPNNIRYREFLLQYIELLKTL